MNDAHAQVGTWLNRTVIDASGTKVGTVTDVYVDDQTKEPDWLAVSTGLFGTKVSFVPIDGARVDGEDVVVAYDKEMIKEAPRIDADGALTVDEEHTLYTHYGRSYTPHTGGESAEPRDGGNAPAAAERKITSDTSGRDASMIRSEEEVSIDKRTQEAGRVKLRKWVETDTVQVTVPVERQVARVVREPVADGDTAGVGEFVEGEEEIVLSEEVVDVDKRVVAKERVGLETETVTDEVPVNETVRKERVVVEGDDVVSDDRGDVGQGSAR